MKPPPISHEQELVQLLQRNGVRFPTNATFVQCMEYLRLFIRELQTNDYTPRAPEDWESPHWKTRDWAKSGDEWKSGQ
jgi:hypothetical protein